jgi:hypothetical protein
MQRFEYSQPVNMDRKQVDNLVVVCSDFKFQEAFAETINNEGIEEADVLTYPGASKGVEDGTLVPAIMALNDLHDLKHVHLFDHMPCGAFGGEESEADHHQSIRLARNVIRFAVPNLSVKGYLLTPTHAEPVSMSNELARSFK